MGLRFRKIISLGGLLRLNISKTGIGVGVGPRGLSLSIGSKGIRRSVGIPGSGLSYQDTTSWKKLNEPGVLAPSDENLSVSEALAPSVKANSSINLWKIAFFLLAILSFIWYLNIPKQKVLNEQRAPLEIAASPNRPLTSAEIRELQTLLNLRGYQVGYVDGVIGPKTSAAVTAYSNRTGLGPKVKIDLEFLNKLKSL